MNDVLVVEYDIDNEKSFYFYGPDDDVCVHGVMELGEAEEFVEVEMQRSNSKRLEKYNLVVSSCDVDTINNILSISPESAVFEALTEDYIKSALDGHKVTITVNEKTLVLELQNE